MTQYSTVLESLPRIRPVVNNKRQSCDASERSRLLENTQEITQVPKQFLVVREQQDQRIVEGHTPQSKTEGESKDKVKISSSPWYSIVKDHFQLNKIKLSLLLDWSQDSNIDTKVHDENGDTFWHFVVKYYEPGVMMKSSSFDDALQDVSCNSNIIALEEEREQLQNIFSAGRRRAEFNRQNHDGDNPAQMAIKLGHCTCLEALCAAIGDQINVINQANENLLHTATKYQSDKAVIFLLEKLKEFNITIDVDAQDESGRTPLHNLIFYCNDQEVAKKLVEKFIEANADRTIRDNCHKTAKDYAVENGYHSDIIQMLSADQSATSTRL